METNNKELFESMPVPKAVISLIIPTVISQIITVIYNMADTFFIGQMNNPNQVAAATLSMPPFVTLTGIANLFGIGGASLISRSLGLKNKENARRSASFSIWASAIITLIYGIVLFLFRPVILPWLGADANTYNYCSDYVFWTTTIGGIPTVWNACLAHLVRAEGYSKEASFGVALGGVMNIILDPILIFSCHLGVTGAAIATMISNVIATLYFMSLLYKNKNSTLISFSPKYFKLDKYISKEIILVGIPSFIMIMMATAANLVLNKAVVAYSNESIAGVGIAKKIDSLAYAIGNGMTQGVLPLIGYTYAANNYDRMKESIKVSFIYSTVVSIITTIILFFGAVPIVQFFIDDVETVTYGQHFLRIISLISPATSIAMIIITIFQATGLKTKPMALSLIQRGMDIPLIYIMNTLAGINGIPWSTLIAAYLVMILAAGLFVPYWKQFKDMIKES